MNFKWPLILPLLFFLSACQPDRPNAEVAHEGHGGATESFYTCPMHPEIREPGPGKCPICHMNLSRVEVDKSEPVADSSAQSSPRVWRCENFPEVTSMQPDLCPLDGTPMVLVRQGPSAGEVVARVRLREAQKRHFRPAFFPVTPMRMEKKIRMLGSAVASQEKESAIPARVAGRVEKVYVESVGSHVAQGSPVADIYSPQLIAAGEEYLLANKNYRQNPDPVFRDLLRQSEERLLQWGVLPKQLRQWRQDQRVPRSITIYANSSGVARARHAVPGKYFNEGDNLYELSELSSIWVEMDVYESDAAHVKLGQEAELSFTALPGRRFHGAVDFIGPVIDPNSRTLKIRTTLDNSRGEIKPGMAAEAYLKVELEGEPLVVPRRALIDTGKRKVVWVKMDDVSFRAQTVQSGFESQGYVEIIQGLSEGDEVVLDGNFLLDAQAQLFGGYEEFRSNP